MQTLEGCLQGFIVSILLEKLEYLTTLTKKKKPQSPIFQVQRIKKVKGVDRQVPEKPSSVPRMPEFTCQMLGTEVPASDACKLKSQVRSLQNVAVTQASCWDGLVHCAHSSWILKDVLESSILGLAIAVRVARGWTGSWRLSWPPLRCIWHRGHKEKGKLWSL